MNFKAELEAMLKEDYIDQEILKQINSDTITNRVKSLYHDLLYLKAQQTNVTNRVLDVMTELYCYKIALNSKISYSTSEAEDSSKYISARIVIPVKNVNGTNPNRIVSNHYLGKYEDFLKYKTNVVDIEKVKSFGGAPVIEKLVLKLKKTYGL